MHDDRSDIDQVAPVDDEDGRRRRLSIVVAVTVVVALVGLVPYALASRAANQEISRVRRAASSAVVDVADLAAWAYGAAGADPIAAALGVDDSQVAAYSATGATWCITIEVDRFVASRSIRFDLDAAGQLSEVSACSET